MLHFYTGFKFKQTESDWLENKKYTFCVCTVTKTKNVFVKMFHALYSDLFLKKLIIDLTYNLPIVKML